MSQPSHPPPPAPPHRHITTFNSTGTSIFSPTHPAPLIQHRDLGGPIQRLAYTSPARPTLLPCTSATAHQDLAFYSAACADTASYPPPLVREHGGTNVWYCDVPPGVQGGPMHSSASLDFVVVVAGRLRLELAGGESREVAVGDMVVQRATVHRWVNPSDREWARMVAVVVGCGESEETGAETAEAKREREWKARMDGWRDALNG